MTMMNIHKPVETAVMILFATIVVVTEVAVPKRLSAPCRSVSPPVRLKGGEGDEILQSILFSPQKMIVRCNLSLMLLQQLF